MSAMRAKRSFGSVMKKPPAWPAALSLPAPSLAGRLPASRAGFVFTAFTTLLRSLVVVGLRRPQDDFALAVSAGDGQRLQDHVEAISRLVRKCRPNCEPKVVLSFTLH